MIWATITRFLAKVPERAWIGLGALAAVLLVFQLGQCTGSSKERARQAQIEAQAAKRARVADDASAVTVRKEQDDVRESNQRARDAAAGSDDPLRSFLDSLRSGKAGSDPSAR